MKKAGNPKKLVEFIKNNPPLKEDGELEYWRTDGWENNLDRDIPNWRKILSESEAWKKIEDIRPRRNYDNFLKVTLLYAPPNIIADYLKSQDGKERKVASDLIFENDAQTLTIDLWKHLDYDTKLLIIIEILERIERVRFEHLREYSRRIERVRFEHLEEFLDEISRIHFRYLEERLEEIEERLERIGRVLSGYQRVLEELFYAPNGMIRTQILDSILYGPYDLLNPLWMKLKAIIEISKDSISLKIISEFEEQIRKKIEIAERLISLLSLVYDRKRFISPSVSKDVMFDPSLVIDTERLHKAVGLMREYSREFTFHISRAFYNLLTEYDDSEHWYITSRFFEQEVGRPEAVISFLRENRDFFSVYTVDERIHHKVYPYFYENLRREIEDRWLRNMIFEEWDFLQRHSWVVSKSKKVFETLKECGVVTVEFSEKAIDRIIRKTLKKGEDDFINTYDKLRFVGKWIVVGVSAVSLPFNPVLSFLGEFGSGILLLLDPKDVDREESHIDSFF